MCTLSDKATCFCFTDEVLTCFDMGSWGQGVPAFLPLYSNQSWLVVWIMFYFPIYIYLCLFILIYNIIYILYLLLIRIIPIDWLTFFRGRLNHQVKSSQCQELVNIAFALVVWEAQHTSPERGGVVAWDAGHMAMDGQKPSEKPSKNPSKNMPGNFNHGQAAGLMDLNFLDVRWFDEVF